MDPLYIVYDIPLGAINSIKRGIISKGKVKAGVGTFAFLLHPNAPKILSAYFALKFSLFRPTIKLTHHLGGYFHMTICLFAIHSRLHTAWWSSKPSNMVNIRRAMFG